VPPALVGGIEPPPVISVVGTDEGFHEPGSVGASVADVEWAALAVGTPAGPPSELAAMVPAPPSRATKAVDAASR